MAMDTYEILNDQGDVINTIVADQAFVEEAYPGHYRLMPEPAPDFTEPNKQTAQELLTATDWAEIPSVVDPANNPHLLNQGDFLTYRNQVRQIAVNPPTNEITDWPIKPSEQWSASA